jgi:hypothetical protein
VCEATHAAGIMAGIETVTDANRALGKWVAFWCSLVEDHAC